MNIDLISLKCFFAVAETGSFTKAADRLGRTQSAVSQQITKIEKNLNKQLLIRGKTIRLTHDGEIFLSYANKINALNTELVDRFTSPELAGEVRFGIPENFAHLYLEGILADFVPTHPRIFLNVECDLTLTLFEKFKRQELDLVMVKMNRPEDFPNGVDIWTEPLKWVGDQSLLSTHDIVPLVLSPDPCVYRSAALQALERCGKRWRIVFSSPSYGSLVAATKAGVGLSVMPLTMIPKGLQVIESTALPLLEDTHVSLLKHTKDNLVINELESFVLKKIAHW